eukprot:5046772-Amphidinium_carterae.1
MQNIPTRLILHRQARVAYCLSSSYTQSVQASRWFTTTVSWPLGGVKRELQVITGERSKQQPVEVVLSPRYKGDTFTTPGAGLVNGVKSPPTRGRVLGGSSALNGHIYTRTPLPFASTLVQSAYEAVEAMTFSGKGDTAPNLGPSVNIRNMLSRCRPTLSRVRFKAIRRLVWATDSNVQSPVRDARVGYYHRSHVTFIILVESRCRSASFKLAAKPLANKQWIICKGCRHKSAQAREQGECFAFLNSNDEIMLLA